MCFTIDSRYPDAMTAQEDILCYKVMKPLNDTQCESLAEGYRYTFDEVNPEVEFEIIDRDEYNQEDEIEAGYHSYTTLDKAQRKYIYMKRWGVDCFVYECIIPEGSIYYRSDKYLEFVSNNLIVKRKL